MSWISGTYIFLALVTLGFYTARRANDPQVFGYIIAYLLLILFTSAATVVMDIMGADNNLIIFHVFNPLEYVIIAMLYRSVFEDRLLSRAVTISIPLMVVSSVVLSLFVQPITVNNSLVILLESILVIIFSLLFIRETIILQRESRLQRYPMFWISVGLLFYFIGSLGVEALLNYLMDVSVELTKKAYRISFVFKYTLFVLLTIGALCRSLFKEDAEQLT